MPTIDMSTYSGGMGAPAGPQFWPLMPLDLLWVLLIALFVVFPEGPVVVLILGCFFVHFFFGGAWRWQLYGLYAMSVASAPALVVPSILEDYRVGFQAFAAFVAIITVIAGMLAPRTVLPEPTGPCRDVTKHTCVVDSQADGVVFMMTAYVPSKIDLRDAEQASYLRSGYKATQGMSVLAGVPGFILTSIAATGTRLYKEAWAAIDPRAFALTKPRNTTPGELSRLPVVVFSHGLGGVPDIYTSLIAELCSHGFVVVGVEHNDGSAAHAELPPRYLQSRPYEPLEASIRGKAREAYGVRSIQLLLRVREVLTAVDFIEALATIDETPDKSKKRVVRASGGRGQTAKARRRAREAEASASAESREHRKKQAGRAPPRSKGSVASVAGKAGKTKGAMMAPGSIPTPQVIEIGAEEEHGEEEEEEEGEAAAAEAAASGGEEAGGDGDADGQGSSTSTSVVRHSAKQRSLHARSVNKMRAEAQARAKAGANARKSDPSEGASSAVDRMQQVNKANEDGDVEMMVELLRNCADPSRVILMGHSFGAATALQAASARSRAFSAVVALDPWALPLHHTTISQGIEPGLPILSLFSPRFAADWNMKLLAPLLDPAARRAAKLRAEKHLAGAAASGAASPRTEEEAESSAGASSKYTRPPAVGECNGIDPDTGTPIVPIGGVDAMDERVVTDRTMAVLEGTEHQSFADVEIVAGLLGRLTKQAGEAPAAENQRLIATTVARWLLGRVLGRAPPGGADEPSSAAMAPDSAAFELQAPPKRSSVPAGRIPASTAAVGGSASGTPAPGAASDAVALVSKDDTGKIVRGLTEFGVGGDVCKWDERIKPVDLAAYRA